MKISPTEFCQEAGILIDSPMGQTITQLSKDQLSKLVSLCDPKEDNLIHVDESGCSINHGNVGNMGIRYEFN